MKKTFLTILTLAFVLGASQSSYAIKAYNEVTFTGMNTGTVVCVDWLYTNEGAPVTPTTPGVNFYFANNSGGANDYTNNSTWYYYYEIENPVAIDLVAFSLNVFPDSVVSTGWITGITLEDPAFGHIIPGEYEPTVATPQTPDDATFNTGTLAPNVSFDFGSGHDITKGEGSAILFISSNNGPTTKFSSMQNGDTFIGSLPVPLIGTTSIPEPTSLILVGSAVLGLIRRIKK